MGQRRRADREPMAELHLAFGMAKLYPVLFWVYQVQVQQCHWLKVAAVSQPIAVLHLDFAMAKLYLVLFWVCKVQVQQFHWQKSVSRPVANSSAAPGFCHGKTIPGIILGLVSPGLVLKTMDSEL